MDMCGGPPPKGVPNSSLRRSYASALNENLYIPSPNVGDKEIDLTTDGEPVIFFTPDEIERSSLPFKFAIVAKCSYGRPSIIEIKETVKQFFGLTEDFVISTMDRRHLLLRFQKKEDFEKVWLKEFIYLKGFLFRFFKWTPSFNPISEPSIVPAWLVIPGLQPNFYHPELLKSIVKPIGPLLKVDVNTLHCTRTDQARVCVELDLSKNLPEKLRIGVSGENRITAFKYFFEKDLLYCSKCFKHGHNSKDCKRGKTTHSTTLGEIGKETSGITSVWKPKTVVNNIGTEKPDSQDTNLHDLPENVEKIGQTSHTHMLEAGGTSGPSIQMENGGIFISDGKLNSDSGISIQMENGGISISEVALNDKINPILHMVQPNDSVIQDNEQRRNNQDGNVSEGYDEIFYESEGRLISTSNSVDMTKVIAKQKYTHPAEVDSDSTEDAPEENTIVQIEAPDPKEHVSFCTTDDMILNCKDTTAVVLRNIPFKIRNDYDLEQALLQAVMKENDTRREVEEENDDDGFVKVVKKKKSKKPREKIVTRSKTCGRPHKEHTSHCHFCRN